MIGFSLSFFFPFILMADTRAISSSVSFSLEFETKETFLVPCCFDLLVRTASSFKSFVLTDITVLKPSLLYSMPSLHSLNSVLSPFPSA